jgi:RNA polymerase sigma-32 factor
MDPRQQVTHGIAADIVNRQLTDSRAYPILSAEEEQALARRWRDQRDSEAAHQLIGSHLRLVAKIARGYSGYGLEAEELIAEGNVGLMQALEKYDPDRGFRFATYAQWWIRAAIQEYVLNSRSMVKMGTTAAQKKLFFNLRRMKNEMRELGEGDLPPEAVTAIAEALEVSEHEVIDMNRRMTGRDASLNTPANDDGETEFQDLLKEGGADQEAALVESDELSFRRKLLKVGLERLNERERRIITARRLTDEPMTLDELGKEYGVSSERVRQIEVRAFEKLQKAMRDAALNDNGARAAA